MTYYVGKFYYLLSKAIGQVNVSRKILQTKASLSDKLNEALGLCPSLS
jgi:hypothetical protein